MDEEFYTQSYFASFPDPLLSKKFLRFADYPTTSVITEEALNSEIRKSIYEYVPILIYNEGKNYYEDPQPIYYQGKPHSAIELEKFKTSNSFVIFLRELDQCVTYINDWIREHEITIEFDERYARANGLMQSISATEEFDYLLSRLKNSDFSEFESYMFGDGKKYLEKLGILIRKEDISLSFRKNQIISLVNDEGLRRCVGGCITVLDLAVSNLQNYGVYTPHQLINRFMTGIVQQAAFYKPEDDTNVILKFSKILNSADAVNDVHIFNYLLERVKKDLKINFLHNVNDPLIGIVTGPYRADREIKYAIDFVFKRYFVNNIKKKLRTSDLVFFISNEIREKIEIYFSTNPLEKLTIVEKWLSELGEDLNFKREDFFSESEGYKFNLDFSLERSIVDRLFQSGWLELDMSLSSRLLFRDHPFFKQNRIYFSFHSDLPFPFEPRKPSYSICYGNLELSWIEIDGKKQKILNYIKQEGAFTGLQRYFQTPPYILANSLIQTTHEMNLFFEALAVKDIKQGLLFLDNNLSEHLALAVYDHNIAWMCRFSNEIERFSKIIKSIKLEAQKKLFIYLVELKQPFALKLQVILNEILSIPPVPRKEADSYIFKLHPIIDEIFSNLFKLKIKNFSGVTFSNFYCKECSLNFDSHIYAYLLHFDFKGCNLDNAIFDTYVSHCKFDSASMDGTVFKRGLIESSFKQTDLRTVRFFGTHSFTLELDGSKFSTTSFLDLLMTARSPVAFFKGADLREVNFQQPVIKDRLVARNLIVNFNNALLQGTDLTGYFDKGFNIVLLDNANLDGATLKKCRLASIHTLHTSMRNIVTGETILGLNQLFQLYQQGHRDFSSDYITAFDPRKNSFKTETLEGAKLSLSILMALHSNGFTNFDRKQMELLPIGSGENRRIMTSRSLLGRGQKVYLEHLEQGQKKFQELFLILSKTFNNYQKFKLNVLNQADLMHSNLFGQNKLEIKGQCFKLTSAFSEAIIHSKQAIYKKNLFVISQLDKRFIQHKPLSIQEQNDHKNFFKTLDQFEQKDIQPAYLPSWRYSRGTTLVNIEELITLLDKINYDFAWHISLLDSYSNSGHVLGAYCVKNKYAYFDSNVGYIDDIDDKAVFGEILTQVIKKSYVIHTDMRIYIDQYYPKIEYNLNHRKDLDKFLFSNLETERKRLSKQDSQLGYLIIDGQIIERAQLYNMGFSYHEDGNLNLPGSLIDSNWELKQKFLDEGLASRKFSINSHDFQEQLLKYVQKEKKSLVRNSEKKFGLAFELEIIKAISVLPTYQINDSPISIDSLKPLFDNSDSVFERKINLRNMEKLLRKKLARSRLFVTELKKNHFQKELVHRLKGIKEKIPLPKALGGLIVSKSLFDIGIALSQNNRQAALIQSLILTYGLFAEPLIEKSIINFPKKFARFVNHQSSIIKISDKILDTKKIVIPTRIFAGTTSNVLDIVSLAYSINKFMEAEYGSKDWRDAIADMSIDSASLLTGTMVVVFNLSFVMGVGGGVVLIVVKGAYEGASLLEEYKYYNLTTKERIKNFFRGSIGLPVSERVQYLRGRQDQMDNLVKIYWEKLGVMRDYFSIPIIAYGGGLGEYVTDNNKQAYLKILDSVNKKILKINQSLGEKGKIPLLKLNNQYLNPGISDILPYLESPFFRSNLSRIIPKRPHDNIEFLCLPAFRNEMIEVENNYMLSKNIPEVQFKCINSVVMLDKAFNSTLFPEGTKTVVLDMEYIYDGIIQQIPHFNNNFLIHNGTTIFLGNINNSIETVASFYVKSPYYSGYINLESSMNSILTLQDNSDVRQHNVTFLPKKEIIMDVTSEKFGGDIEGKFKSRNIKFVIGRPQKQDIYNCYFSLYNSSSFLTVELSGLGGTQAKPDIYNNCQNVILYASSYYRLQSNFNTTQFLGWSFASIKIDADQAGTIIIEPIIENLSELRVQSIKFLNLNIFRDATVTYCSVLNYLLIVKKFFFLPTDFNLEKFSIELKHYWNFEENRSNYIVYDQYHNLVTPLLSKELIYSFKNVYPSAECFYPEQFLLHRQLHFNTNETLTNLTKTQDFLSMIEIEGAVENILFDPTILGPFELNPNVKILSFIDIYPSDYTLTMGNEDKNFFNLISKETNVTSYYGSKNEDFYIINLNEIKGERLVKINNFDSDISIDRLEIVSNHSCYELCIDKTKKDINDNHFLFYILNREIEIKNSCSKLKSVCSEQVRASYPDKVDILIQNYFLSSAYQHIEICVFIENESRTCFIPFLDEDTQIEPDLLFARYFRSNQNEEHIFTLDPNFSEIIVEGELSFQAIRREDDFLLKKESNGGVGYNPFFLWFPDFYSSPNEWDLFHIYSTKNATQVNSKMRDLDNLFLRKSSEFAIDYTLLENDVQFYELSFSQYYNLVIHNHNLLNFSKNRTRRDLQFFSSTTEYSIGYLKIPKNNSFILDDIMVARENSNLVISVDMRQNLTNEKISYYVIVMNWDKPEHRLAGLIHNQLSILDLNQWGLTLSSIRRMQKYIHEKILECQILTFLESNLQIMVLWNKLRVFLLLPLPIKNYDTHIIMHFMQKTLNFESINELLDFLPENHESSFLINDLKSKILENEKIIEKIKHLLIYHVVKASFFDQEISKKIIIDSFVMIPELLITRIYNKIRIKVSSHNLSEIQNYIQTLITNSTEEVKLSEWLENLSSNVTEQQNKTFTRKKRFTQKKLFNDNFIQDKTFENIILPSPQAVTSSATRTEGWLNSLINMFYIPFIPKSFTLNLYTHDDNYKETYRKSRIGYEENQHQYSSSFFDGSKKSQHRPLEQLNEQLMLGQLVWHEAKKIYSWFKLFISDKKLKPQLKAKKFPIIFISDEKKIFWKESLVFIENQLIDLSFTEEGKKDVHWLKPILEDRKEEFNYLTQTSEQPLNKVNIFNKNLRALKAEIKNIKRDSIFVQHDKHGSINSLTCSLNRGFFRAQASTSFLSNHFKSSQEIDRGYCSNNTYYNL